MSPNGQESSPPEHDDRRQLLNGVRRVVVKRGTNVLTRETGEMALGRTHGLVEDVVDLYRRGLEIILVSSGAIGMGLERLALKQKPKALPALQASAAIGQIRLMSVYEQAFGRFGITTAQILLTDDDFANRERYLNLRNTMEHLLEHRVIPIVNENDTVSTSEIESSLGRDLGTREEQSSGSKVFGDHDRLSAQVMSKLDAERLVLLSEVNGIYAEYSLDPKNAAGERIEPLSVVGAVTPEIESMARHGSSRGRGGMVSKLQSIKIALDAGGMAVIASGREAGNLQRILAGEDVGTLFRPRRRIATNKRWLAHAALTSGRVVVNAGAEDALVNRRSSLLFAGVIRVEGDFVEGDVVLLTTESGKEIGKGRSNYNVQDAKPFLGKRSDEIAELSGKHPPELIHSDHIVLLA